ncbi:MAG: DUF4382 domain-containing protein, partial [Aeromicrobium sp.]|nr:DUF4382 domain-containing protein [Burkholderiales bacterium]
GFDAVNITVTKVRVHQSSAAADTDAGWTDITLSPAKKINLLNLTNGVLEQLGQTPLSAGQYSQLRLVLAQNGGATFANSVVASGTVAEVAFDTPSAVQSGIKLVNQFTVIAGQRVDLVLDFDACKSIVTKGNGQYSLKPVVKVIPTAVNGIQGFMATTVLGDRVSVSAQQNGTIVSSTVPSTTGEFFLSRLPVGNYDVVFVADNRATAVIASVPVATTTSITNVSTVSTPTTLLAATAPMRSISGTVSMTPTSATEYGDVSAKQSFAGGPTVTIRERTADAVNGSYTLGSLPSVAPQLGSYSATLPIALSTQLNTVPGTGKYVVQASATGYTTKSIASVDVTLVNQTGVNFALIP